MTWGLSSKILVWPHISPASSFPCANTASMMKATNPLCIWTYIPVLLSVCNAAPGVRRTRPLPSVNLSLHVHLSERPPLTAYLQCNHCHHLLNVWNDFSYCHDITCDNVFVYMAGSNPLLDVFIEAVSDLQRLFIFNMHSCDEPNVLRVPFRGQTLPHWVNQRDNRYLRRFCEVLCG